MTFTAASFAHLFPVMLFFKLSGIGYPKLHLKWTVFLAALNRTFTVCKSCASMPPPDSSAGFLPFSSVLKQFNFYPVTVPLIASQHCPMYQGISCTVFSSFFYFCSSLATRRTVPKRLDVTLQLALCLCLYLRFSGKIKLYSNNN